MQATRIQTIIQVDGELHLTELPVRKGDQVEAILLCPDRSADANANEAPEATKRRNAVKEFLKLANSSTFRSTAPYPSRAPRDL